MKKLAKLSINPERVMKNEELVNLRGGDDYYSEGICKCFCLNASGTILGPSIITMHSKDECSDNCSVFYGDAFYGSIYVPCSC